MIPVEMLHFFFPVMPLFSQGHRPSFEDLLEVYFP